jgi:hypothetical protein
MAGVPPQPEGKSVDAKRQSDLYWRQMEQLKAACVCMRLVRNRYARRVRTVELIKAVASSGAVAGWFATDSLKLTWAIIIAAAQLLDVVKEVFPFTRLHRQAAALTVALETLFIEAEDDWEKIYVGKIGEEAIISYRTRLKKAQLEMETRHFPEGFDPPWDVVKLAIRETRTYFQVTYATGGDHERDH